MKFTFSVSPNLRQKQSTKRMMLELTIALLIVYAFSLFYYFKEFGSEYAIQALLMMTPYAYRTPKSAIQRLETIEKLHTTLDFYIQVWQKQ